MYPVKTSTKSIVMFRGQFYRCAGYRYPKNGERYVTKTGSIGRVDANNPTDGPRLIVREMNLVDAPGQEMKY